MKINEFVIDDIAYTLKYFTHKFVDWENTRIFDRDEKNNPYKLAANAALIVANRGFGTCFAIDDFISCVKDGFFIDDDGTGKWVDKDGNDLGYIKCDAKWLTDNVPAEAAFIMWYNK